MSDVPRSRADRLEALVRHCAPKSAETLAATGQWPAIDAADGGRAVRCSPYTFSTLANGQRKLTILDDAGDVALTGVGATVEAALAATEAKL